jgi:glucosamine kinase
MFFAGIDAGQTATLAAISDVAGTVLGRGSAGPADEVGAPPGSTRLREALEHALQSAIRDAGLSADTHFASIVAGISGYEGHVYGVPARLPSDRVRLMHDAPIAHAGAFGGRPGVVVIAGTGSVAYAVDETGNASTYGGWGYVFGDEGSAFWIGRYAISAVAVHETCAAVPVVLDFFKAESMRALVRAFYSGSISRERVAAFAPICIAASREITACGCLATGVVPAAVELAWLARRAASDTLHDVAFVGGLMRDTWFKDRTYREVQKIAPALRVIEPMHEPVIGALLLARQS